MLDDRVHELLGKRFREGGLERAARGTRSDPSRIEGEPAGGAESGASVRRPVAQCDAVAVAEAPRRSSKWSPTLSELAIAVSAGLTAPMLGKTLVSTT